VSAAKLFWDGMLADVLAYQPRSRRNRPTVGVGKSGDRMRIDSEEGVGSDGRERGRLTGIGQAYFQHRYHSGSHTCAANPDGREPQ